MQKGRRYQVCFLTIWLRGMPMKGTARRDQHRCDGSPSQSQWRKADEYYWDDNEDGWVGVRPVGIWKLGPLACYENA